MTTDIAQLIDQRPHLKDPLELYAKWRTFADRVKALLAGEQPVLVPEGPNGYPPQSAETIFRLLVENLALNPDQVAPLGRALAAGAVDFQRLPLGELPVIKDLSCGDEELAGLLFLLSRPYFLALGQQMSLSGSRWEGGRCPLCSARPALASVVEGPQRNLHCSFCATSGPYRFIGCPNCATEDPAQLNTIASDDEPGFRVITCDGCNSYLKVIDSDILSRMTMDLADMASLPLDIVAQGRGYSRLSPNPISLKKMG